MKRSEFVQHCLKFVEISQELNDSWEIVSTPNGEDYLRTTKLFRRKDTIGEQEEQVNDEMPELDHNDPSGATVSTIVKDEVYMIEYHVVYSLSYQVPVLYLNVQDSRGKILNLQSAWKLLGALKGFGATGIYQALTQTEHPFLYRPYLCIHPCKTQDIFDSLPSTKQPIVTFLSTYGPLVKLDIDPRYGLK
ncbi:ubiquitin-like-conjugating enzyme ATG10 [Anopheles aquasalis]|uniref:ubiquitin-like-conjugating enzyme ATG10 n=1 Tax=Anopheles aquasalis TaxID=42839 RepID=UPI00215A3272|nr:ubiquitin-like-conjugating enzyme ATG10 [Anopheles aquasalis]